MHENENLIEDIWASFLDLHGQELTPQHERIFYNLISIIVQNLNA